MSRILILIGLIASLSVSIAAPPDAEQDEDFRMLASAGVPTDLASLCDLIRRTAPRPDDETRIAELIKDLSAADFDTRKHATQRIATFSRRALPALRIAQTSGDAEAVQRATACIRQIEREARPSVLMAAARVLGRSTHEEAPGALLIGLDGADDVVAQEISHALTKLARRGAPMPAALASAIADSHPVRRAVAAEAILRSQQPRSVEIVRPLLRDSSAIVRYRVSVALVETGEREGIGAIIESLSDLPINQLFDADEFLAQIAGTDAPTTEPADTPAERRAFQDAWQAWWSPRAAKFDLPVMQSLNRPDVALACINTTGNEGSVVELDCAPKGNIRILRRIDKLMYPVTVEPAPRGRVLVCEFRGNKVTERDFTGKIHWAKQIEMPVSAQRVSGGGYFVASRREIMCLNRDGTERFRFTKANTIAARMLPNRSIIVVGMFGICQTLDETGKILGNFPISRGRVFTSMQPLPGERVLLPDYGENCVVEYDANGQQVWRAEVNHPTAACRLPNGRTLVSSQLNARIAELDADGKQIREFRPGDGLQPIGIVPGR